MNNFNVVPSQGKFGESISVINQNFQIAQQEMQILENFASPRRKYATVVATSQTESETDVLPATGSTDTIYRVGNWDGAQFDETSYTEYAWGGTQYVPLSTNSQIGEVFDISEYKAVGGTLATFADLGAALNGGANIPQSLQKGGMSVKFVQSSDNKYIQARCMAQNFTTVVANWQGVDAEPTAGSDNLVKSGGVAFATQKSIYDYQIAGLLTASGLKAPGYDGRYTIIPIQKGDTIVATASAAYSYFAIIKQLPDFSQANPSIPYATGESRRYFQDETQTINVSAQDAQYLIVELWRQGTGAPVQNTAPLQLIINGYDYVVTKTQESFVLNNTLKSGCFVPKYGQYVNITDTTITIPAGSRIIYKYNQFYTNNSDVVLTRASGAQAEFVCFDTEDNTYKIYSYGELNLKSNLLVCFYVRNSNECSLPHMTYKINGNYDFHAIDNPVENSNNGLVTSGSIYNYVRVNSDTERAVIGNRKKYSSDNTTTTVFLDNVKLQKTHLYRLALKAVTTFTPSENYTIKVMSANSDASLLTIAQLNGIQISDNVFYFYWGQESSLTYRIGQFGTQALNTISISLSDVTDEMSGSIFPESWEKGVYIDNTGGLVKDALWCVSEKIRCSLGDIIHWRSGLSTSSYQISLVLFDANDTLISYISVGSGTGGQWQRVLQIDNANVAYCRASFYTTAADGFISIYNNSNPDDFKYIKFNQELLFSIKQAVNVKDILYQNKHKESSLMAVLLHKGNDNIKVNDKLSLLHCTDLHGDSGNLARIVEYRNNYLTYLDDAIHTGDTVAGTINDSNPFVSVNGANTILNVAGNHEAWLSSSDTDYLATGKQVYDKIFAPSIAYWNVVQPENAASDGKCYYYKDYRNFRLIVLDNVHWHTGGNQHIIDDASVQKAWFESVLTDAAINSKIVVCAMHYPPIHIIPLANVKGFNDYGVNENTDIGDGWYANDEIFECVDAFINEDNGMFAGWLIGHTHRDYIGHVKGHTSQPIVILRNCGTNSYSATNKNVFGTSAQDCFNVITFDWVNDSTHLIKIVRIGNDMDMYGLTKKSISLNIVDGTIINVE